MKKYLLIEGWYDGVDARVFDDRKEASVALLQAFEDAARNAEAPIEDKYWNDSCALVKTEYVEDLWRGVIKEVEI